MALSTSALGGLIDTNLSGAGAIGGKRVIFANAVGIGIVNYLIGIRFSTTDSGTGAGGKGTGTGITGMVPATMIPAALGAMVSQGDKALPMMVAIMDATVLHMAAATLTTADSSVGVGGGAVVVGSIAAVVADMATSIFNALQAAGAKGTKCMNLSTAIATGVCAGLATGTGSTTISGSSGPSATRGSGTGTLS